MKVLQWLSLSLALLLFIIDLFVSCKVISTLISVLLLIFSIIYYYEKWGKKKKTGDGSVSSSVDG